MSKLLRSTSPKPLASLSLSILTATLALGCGADPATEEARVEPLESAHPSVGSFVLHVEPGARGATVTWLPRGADGSPRLSPAALDSLPVVSDDLPGTGPDYSVELATDQDSFVDTYQQGAIGGCPAGSWCADVTFTHFYPGLRLSAVYAQITGIVDSNGAVDHAHDPVNGVTSTPFGLDLSHGAFDYTDLAAKGTLAKGQGSRKTWAFKNPDDKDFWVYLDVRAALRPMLWFGADNTVTQTAPLQAGQPASIHYEYARLPTCRGTNWQFNAFLKGTNIDIHQMSYPGTSSETYFDVHMVMPFGPGVAFWFENRDDNGCSVWDSQNKQNYFFGVDDSNVRIHFSGPESDIDPFWTQPLQEYRDGTLTGGVNVTVDYELGRIECLSRDRYGRVPSGIDAQMFYSFDGSLPFTGVSMLGTPFGVSDSINGVAGRVFVPPVVAVPAGSHYMRVYFYTNDPACNSPQGSGYDSDFGSDYHFYY